MRKQITVTANARSVVRAITQMTLVLVKASLRFAIVSVLLGFCVVESSS